MAAMTQCSGALPRPLQYHLFSWQTRSWGGQQPLIENTFLPSSFFVCQRVCPASAMILRVPSDSKNPE
jgi:hypothetical protein